jgi:hypothetical protein
MKTKNIKIWHICGILFTLILGTLLHFTYEWSGYNPIVGFFSATDESTIEHLKMIFMPFFLFSIFEYFAYGKNTPGFILTKGLSVSIGMISIVVLFYLYTWIVGTNYLWMDIAIFVFGVVISYVISYFILKSSIENYE